MGSVCVYGGVKLKGRMSSRVATAVLLLVAAAALPGLARGAPAQGGPPPAQVAAMACGPMQAQMGAQFAAKFGSMAGCIAKVTPLAEAATAACATAADPQACMQAELQKRITSLVGSGGGSGGPSAAALGATVSKKACANAKKQAGAKFPYASTAACTAKIKAKATTLAKAALAKCKTNQACLQRELGKSATTLQALLAPPR